MASLVRPAAVAGQFYPADPETLISEVREYAKPADMRKSAIGCVVPHAGYMYSAHVAGALYSTLELPKRYIILCPNHTGVGAPLAIMSEGAWQTPLGEVPIDTEMAEALKSKSEFLKAFEAVEKAYGDADKPFVRRLRNAAIARFDQLAFPTTRDEEFQPSHPGRIRPASYA